MPSIASRLHSGVPDDRGSSQLCLSIGLTGSRVPAFSVGLVTANTINGRTLQLTG